MGGEVAVLPAHHSVGDSLDQREKKSIDIRMGFNYGIYSDRSNVSFEGCSMIWNSNTCDKRMRVDHMASMMTMMHETIWTVKLIACDDAWYTGSYLISVSGIIICKYDRGHIIKPMIGWHLTYFKVKDFETNIGSLYRYIPPSITKLNLNTDLRLISAIFNDGSLSLLRAISNIGILQLNH